MPAPQCPRTGPYIINKIMATVCVVKDLLICQKKKKKKKKKTVCSSLGRKEDSKKEDSNIVVSLFPPCIIPYL